MSPLHNDPVHNLLAQEVDSTHVSECGDRKRETTFFVSGADILADTP